MNILAWLGGLAVALIIGGLIGIDYRDKEYKVQLAKAKAAFERTVSEANNAYANQKIQDDKELEALRQEATTAPANNTIAVKKDMASRIGAIR